MTRPALLALCGAAFALRLVALEASGLWYDEAVSALTASKDWAGILEFARAPKLEHPPLYYFLLSAWRTVAGDSEFALRFFSLWFGVLAALLLWRLARRWFGARTAAWTLALTAASPFLIVYAQEARMYTLALCAALLALDLFLRWLAGERRAGAWYMLCSLLSIAIHYYAGLLLVLENLTVLAMRTRPLPPGFLRRWLAWNAVLALAGAGVLMAAPGPRETLALVFSHPLFAGRSVSEIQRVLSDLMIGGVVIRPLPAADPAASALALVPVLIGVWWVSREGRWREPRYFVLVLLLAIPLLAAAVPYIYSARYLFVTVPALLLLTALALGALRPRPAMFFAVLALYALANAYGLWRNYGYVKSPYREMAAQVTRSARPTDGLILTGPSQRPLELYYLRGNWERRYIPRDPDTAELTDIEPEMRAMQRAHPRLWVVAEQASLVDPGNNVARWLSLNAFPVAVTWFRSDMVLLANSGNAQSEPRAWQTDFGEWLQLERAAFAPERAAAADAVAVELTWHARKPIPQRLQLLMTLRLLDAGGKTVAERVSKPCDGFCAVDDWIPGEAVTDRHGLAVPAETPAGDYRLWLGVWSPRQAQFLPAGASGAEGIELGRVRVVSDGPR